MHTYVSASRFRIPRREFLRLGSAAAVGLAATGLSADIAAGITVPMPLLSAGFCSEMPEEIGSGDACRVVAADRLRAAERHLAATGARITVHQFRRAAAHRDLPLELSLRAYYPSFDPATGAKTPVIAWVWRGSAHRQFSSNRTAFTVPVDAGDALHLGIDRTIETAPRISILRRMSGALATRRDERAEIAAFAPRGGADGLPLRRGTWLLAIRESDADAAPSWSSLHLARSGNDFALRTFGGGEPAFSYLIISIDAAKA